jgi:lysophospholipase
VVLSPGRTEPIEKYYEVVEELRARGFTILIHDWRGQGLSGRLTPDPLKGHGDDWRSYVSDYQRLLEAFTSRLPRPWLAMGHSMGGGLTALALMEGEERFAGAVLTAPMMGVDLGGKPPRLVRALAWLLSRLGAGERYVQGPGAPLYGPFADNALTHDPARWNRTVVLVTERAELRLGGPTWGWLKLALQIQDRLSKARLTIPLLVVAAEEERLVDNAAAKAFTERSGGRWLLVPASRHEILMETDDRRAVFWTAFDGFVGEVT